MSPVDPPAADGSSERRQKFDAEPPMVIDAEKRYTATMVTSKGTIVIALDPIAAPKTVNNFVFLARYHYFDGVGFHRVIPGFVIQGGDPEGTGMGGPGYRFADELPKPPDRTRTAASSSSSRGPTAPDCRPSTRCSARWSRAVTWCRRSTRSGPPRASRPSGWSWSR